MTLLAPLLDLLAGPLAALSAGIAGWGGATALGPRAPARRAANDDAPLSRPRAARAIDPPIIGERAMLGKSRNEGRGDTRRGTVGLSVIGADVTVTGDVTTEGDLHLDGTVQGDISCGSLIQGPGGRVVGTIRAKAARLAGTIEGEVSAAALTIEKSARLRGDAAYQTLQIETGAQVDGRMTHLAAGLAAGQAPELRGANDAPLQLVDASDAAG